MEKNSYIEEFVEHTSYFNHLVLPPKLFGWMPHILQSWVRGCIFATLVYLLTCFFCISFWKRYSASTSGSLFISERTMVSQIVMTLNGVPIGTLLATGIEYMVLKGWTKCFLRLSDTNLVAYVYNIIAYIIVLEVGAYWLHRSLHDIKPLYKYIHCRHHLYNKEVSLSPFAGWATHPLESIILGSPHAVAILIVPIHYTTHLVIFLVHGIWGIAIHDRSRGSFWPILNAKYHTLHHTSGHHNYGNFTIWMDQLFGTLRIPKCCANNGGSIKE